MVYCGIPAACVSWIQDSSNQTTKTPYAVLFIGALTGGLVLESRSERNHTCPCRLHLLRVRRDASSAHNKLWGDMQGKENPLKLVCAH